MPTRYRTITGRLVVPIPTRVSTKTIVIEIGMTRDLENSLFNSPPRAHLALQQQPPTSTTPTMPGTTRTLVLALAALAAASADAHSKMSLPKPTWDNGYGTNSPSGTIDGPSALTAPSGMSFSTDPTSNTKAFTAALKNSKYGSLKALAFATQKTEAGASKECGFSKTNGTPQPLPDTVQWDELTPSHEGPCEVWCDNTMAFHGDNCAKSYTGTPAKLPYDKSKCAGAKVLMSIWLALHVPTWQVYTNCAPIGSGSATGGGSSGATTGGGGSSGATTKAPAQGNGGASGGTTDEYSNSGGNTGGGSTGATNTNTGGSTNANNKNTGNNNNNKNTGNTNTNKNTGNNNNSNKNTGSNNNNNKNKNTGNANNNANNRNAGTTNTGANNNNKNTGNNWGNGGNSWTFGKQG